MLFQPVVLSVDNYLEIIPSCDRHKKVHCLPHFYYFSILFLMLIIVFDTLCLLSKFIAETRYER